MAAEVKSLGMLYVLLLVVLGGINVTILDRIFVRL